MDKLPYEIRSKIFKINFNMKERIKRFDKKFEKIYQKRDDMNVSLRFLRILLITEHLDDLGDIELMIKHDFMGYNGFKKFKQYCNTWQCDNAYLWNIDENNINPIFNLL